MRNRMAPLLCFLVLPIMLMGDSKEIARDNTHLREGPGCFYPLIGILQKGTLVEIQKQEPGWLETKALENIGWISVNAIATPESGSVSSLSSLGTTSMPALISKASASGAVRGFAQKFIHYHEGDSSFLQYYDHRYFTPQQYNDFKHATYRNKDISKIRNRYTALPIGSREYHIDFDLEKAGLAIASQIAKAGLITDSTLTAYINLVGTLLIENCELYYYPFKFFILEDDRPAAYSTPNGMIFLSKGLLMLMENEAELACALGHEMAHTIYKHGYREILERRDMIVAEEAFDQLDEEVPESDTTFQALEDMALNMYEAATYARQMEYEYEADQFGAIYAYRAGYDPDALSHLLRRVKQNTQQDFWHPETNWPVHKIEDRSTKVDDFIGKKLDKDPHLNMHWKSRFQAHTAAWR